LREFPHDYIIANGKKSANGTLKIRGETVSDISAGREEIQKNAGLLGSAITKKIARKSEREIAPLIRRRKKNAS